mmetsp:Transcript_107770/g.310343  ORF Transcript_107770/g.310343 Transcript_107770/m.310343 type:complete len:228 (-) Transcript_107770:181-864(-)
MPLRDTRHNKGPLPGRYPTRRRRPTWRPRRDRGEPRASTALVARRRTMGRAAPQHRMAGGRHAENWIRCAPRALTKRPATLGECFVADRASVSARATLAAQAKCPCQAAVPSPRIGKSAGSWTPSAVRSRHRRHASLPSTCATLASGGAMGSAAAPSARRFRAPRIFEPPEIRPLVLADRARSALALQCWRSLRSPPVPKELTNLAYCMLSDCSAAPKPAPWGRWFL